MRAFYAPGPPRKLIAALLRAQLRMVAERAYVKKQRPSFLLQRKALVAEVFAV